mmetsp:Transcript_128960/g.234297  ORF Transcript_128960/g.234297 Transcript_128960/m.234297 type:complete len:347 (+) Transcript_128960:118-1158(+)
MTTDNRFVQFNKTKMCKFEVLGRCKKGRECPFAHTSKELKGLPDLRCTKLCKSLILTGICADETCNYAHSKDELRSTGTFHKTKLCRFMQTGHCALGAKCNFAHSSSELREADDSPEYGALEWEGMPPGLGLAGMPPGLGWEGVYAGADATSDVTDLSALAQSLELMLSKQEAYQEPALEAPELLQKDTGLQQGSPAYVRLGSNPKTSRDGGNGLGTLNFDYLNAEINSMSTRSPQSPPTPPSPSGSRSSSGKSGSGNSGKTTGAIGSGASGYNEQDATMPVYFPEGPWDSPVHGAAMGGLAPPWGFGAGVAGMDPRFASLGNHAGLAAGPLRNDYFGAQMHQAMI